MPHKKLSLTILVCIIIPISICTSFGQNAVQDSSGATIKGEVIDATPEQNPIVGVTVKIVNSADGQEYIVTTDKDGVYEKTGLPAGRYAISVSKAGYGDRFGKSEIVAAGGEIFNRIKMRKQRKQKSFFTYFFEFNGFLIIVLTFYLILYTIGIGYLIFYFISKI